MLRRFRMILLLLAIAGWQLSAAPQLVRAVSMSGQYYTASNPKGVDNLFIFKSLDDASIESIDGKPITWTEIPTQKTVARMNVFQSLEDGHCYLAVTTDKKDTSTFAVIDYSLHTIDALKMDIDLDCQQTVIHYDSLAYTYFTPTGEQTTWPYKVAVKYINQQWDSAAVAWQEVEITDSIEINSTGVATLQANLTDTKFEFEESEVASVLFAGSPVAFSTDTMTAVAVKQHMLYYITKRGSTQENEKEGPYGTENLKSSVVHSAPINVLFEAHPSDKADVYSWSIKKGQQVVTQRNDKDMRYTFDEVSESAPEYYNVDLVVKNSEHPDCVDSSHVEFELHNSFILVPNVFTPNGDGVNDEFRVAYRSICEFHCWVYNRWQHLVYQWDDPAKGWDGTYAGKKEPDSAFIYIIEAKGCDGQKYKLKGTVNLLRGK